MAEIAEQSKRNLKRGNPAWRKGVSGNPKGSPPRELQVPEILRRIGEEIDPETRKTKLEGLMQKVYDFAKQGQAWAVQTILDRTEGKVKERLGIEDDTGIDLVAIRAALKASHDPST